MKNHLFMCVVFGLILATLGAASAQAQSDHSLVAKIPFAFWLQQEKFPAGEYVVDPLQSGYLRLHSSDGGSVILHVLPNYSRPNLEPKGKLIFNRYGDQYFLREAWIPSFDFGMNFMPSKVEVGMAKHFDQQKELVAVERH
jgi:hypothetical protein